MAERPESPEVDRNHGKVVERESEERIEVTLLDGSKEEWVKWLVGDPEELLSTKEETPELFVEVHRLARKPDSMITPGVLFDAHERISFLKDEEKVTDEQIAPWLARIESKHEDLRNQVLEREITLEEMRARLTAREMGAQSPQKILEAYRNAEEHKVPFEIGPGREPQFYVLYQENDQLLQEKREEWEARAILVQAAAIKLNAESVEDVLNNNKYAIELDKIELEILFRLPGVLPATSVYTTIIGSERFLAKDAPEKKGTPLQRIFLGTDKKVEDIELLGAKGASKVKLGSFLSQEEISALGKEREKLKNCPDSVWFADQKTFMDLRRGLRFWLKTRGRKMLFKDEGEWERRKDDNFLVEERARDAEQVAWNFVFTTGFLENYNSRVHRERLGARNFAERKPFLVEVEDEDEKKEEKPAGRPSNFMTLYMWMAMHPQERLEAKILRGEKPKEEWSALGTWAINNISRGSWPISEGKMTFPRIIRDNFIPDGITDTPFLRNYLGEQGHTMLLEGFLNNTFSSEIYEDLTERKKIKGKKWKDVGDAPFVNNRFDTYRWAFTIFQALKKGLHRDYSLQDLSEAVRMLELTKEERENILMVVKGVDPKSAQLKPAMGRLDWGAYLRELKRQEPNYFLEAKSLKSLDDDEKKKLGLD